MGALVNAQMDSLGSRVAYLHLALLTSIALAMASPMIMTEPMAASASVQAVSLALIAPRLRPVRLELPLRMGRTRRTTMHMGCTAMKKMMIVTLVIVTVTALPLTWTGLMDVTANVPTTTLAAIALSLQCLVQSWVAGGIVSLGMAGAVRQMGIAWLDIMGLEKQQKHASVRVVWTRCASAMTLRTQVLALCTVMCTQIPAMFLKVFTALWEKKTTEALTPILRLSTNKTVSNATRWSSVHLIS
jgi:hypothetical protein